MDKIELWFLNPRCGSSFVGEQKIILSLHLMHFSVAFSTLFCGLTPATCKDLAQNSSTLTRCAVPVKSTLLGRLSSPFVHCRTVCVKWTTLSIVDFVENERTCLSSTSSWASRIWQATWFGRWLGNLRARTSNKQLIMGKWQIWLQCKDWKWWQKL